MKEGKTINVSAALISGRDKGLILPCVLRSSVCLPPSLSLCLSICLSACLSVSLHLAFFLLCLFVFACLTVFFCLSWPFSKSKRVIDKLQNTIQNQFLITARAKEQSRQHFFFSGGKFCRTWCNFRMTVRPRSVSMSVCPSIPPNFRPPLTETQP